MSDALAAWAKTLYADADASIAELEKENFKLGREWCDLSTRRDKLNLDIHSAAVTRFTAERLLALSADLVSAPAVETQPIKINVEQEPVDLAELVRSVKYHGIALGPDTMVLCSCLQSIQPCHASFVVPYERVALLCDSCTDDAPPTCYAGHVQPAGWVFEYPNLKY